MKEQERYELSVISDALKIKVCNLHMALENDLPEELWEKYDDMCNKLNLLIYDLDEMY